jgi:hypothetical protein
VAGRIGKSLRYKGPGHYGQVTEWLMVADCKCPRLHIAPLPQVTGRAILLGFAFTCGHGVSLNDVESGDKLAATRDQ